MRCAGSGMEIAEFKRERRTHWPTYRAESVRYEVVVPQVASVSVKYENAYLSFRGNQPVDAVGTVSHWIGPVIGTASHVRIGEMKVAQCPNCQQWIQWVNGRLQEHSALGAA